MKSVAVCSNEHCRGKGIRIKREVYRRIVEPILDEQCPYCRLYVEWVPVEDDWKPEYGLRHSREEYHRKEGRYGARARRQEWIKKLNFDERFLYCS